MKFSSMFRQAMIASCLGLVALSSAQNQQHDSYGWNPNNWEITVVPVGVDVSSSWVLILGVPVNILKIEPWNDWHGPFAAINGTHTQRSGYVHSDGYKTYYLQWVGVGPAPAKTLVRIDYQAAGATNLIGSVALACGTSAPTVSNNWFGLPLSLNQSAVEYRYIPVSSLSGAGVFTIESHASAAISGGDEMYAWADAKANSIAIKPTAILATSDPDPTFHKGGVDQQVQNNQDGVDDAKNHVIDTAVAPTGLAEFPFMATSTFGSYLYGFWQPSTIHWDWSDIQSNDPSVAYFARYYPNSTVSNMIAGTPSEYDNHVDAVDPDQHDTAFIHLKVHAPWETPWPLTDQEMTGTPMRTGNEKQGGTGGTVTVDFNVHIGIAKQAFTIDGGTSTPVPVGSPLVPFLVSSADYGQTAQVTLNDTGAPSFANGSNPARMYFVEKIPLYRRKTGSYYAYDRNGYAGIKSWEATYWCSNTKSAAETNDKIFRLNWRTIQPDELPYNPEN